MKEKVLALAKGSFTYDTPSVVLSPAKISMTVTAGEKETAYIDVSNSRKTKIKGFGSVEEQGIQFLPVFDDEENRLELVVDADQIKSVRPESTYNIGRHENGKRQKQQIGIHSLRLGSEAGTHEILISTGKETLTLRHEAKDRSLFADGAMQAAQFLAGKPAGLYTMQDLINQEEQA